MRYLVPNKIYLWLAILSIGFLISGCEIIETKNSLHGADTDPVVDLYVTCISKVEYCDRLLEKDAEIIRGKVDDSFRIEIPMQVHQDLLKVNLCGTRSVTPNFVFQLGNQEEPLSIVTINTLLNEVVAFEAVDFSVNFQGGNSGYPCTKKDREIVLKFMNKVF